MDKCRGNECHYASNAYTAHRNVTWHEQSYENPWQFNRACACRDVYAGKSIPPSNSRTDCIISKCKCIQFHISNGCHIIYSINWFGTFPARKSKENVHTKSVLNHTSK